MEGKKTAALVSLWMILLASFALVVSIPQVSSPAAGTYRYRVMGIGGPASPGNVVIIDSLDETPMDWRAFWNFTIPSMGLNQSITFSEPWPKSGYGWIVNLTVPATSYTNITHMFYDRVSTLWIRFVMSMKEDGKGWIFLNNTGDVECHTFTNNTGVYWRYPSPKAGELAALPGQLPSPGPDGVAGTTDDGFGDRNTTCPRGSSILLLKTWMTAEYHAGEGIGWKPVFSLPWPQVFTTGNASTIVKQPPPGWPTGNGSPIHGANQTVVGEPWEYYAGRDHTGDKVEWAHQNSAAYVIYVCAWALLDMQTTMPYTNTGKYDACFTMKEKLVKEDLLIADIDCNEICDIFDLVKIGISYNSREANFGEDGKPYSPCKTVACPPGEWDDQILRNFNWDGRADMKPERGLIDIFDLVKCGLDYNSFYNSSGVFRPY